MPVGGKKTLKTDIHSSPGARTHRRTTAGPTGKIEELDTIILMPHSRCNCRCVMCDVWKSNRDLDELPARALEKHKEDFERLGVKHVVLSGGEPLMHGNLWRVCRMFNELDIRITLESSGLLLGDYAKDVVKWVDTVIVPIDGTESLHDRVRNTQGAFSRLKEGVEMLRELDQDQKIVARSVIQKMNYPYLPDIIQASIDLELDGIELVAVDVSTPGYNRATLLQEDDSEDLRLRSVDLLIFKTIADRVKKEFHDELEVEFVRGGTSSLDSLVLTFDQALSSIPSNTTRCNVPWHSAVIEATGKVKPCAFQPAFGTIRKNDFASVLNSSEAISFRQKLDPSTNAICAGCTMSHMFIPDN